jgi:multiple sugar transport system substrate-binding protein
MMILQPSKRAFLLGTAAVAASGLGMGPVFAQDATLRMFWWGNERRADLQNKINALYEQRNPSVKILGEFAPFNDYWPRLATAVAGGNPPDIINMDYRYLAEYGKRGVLLPLDEYIGHGLSFEDFGIGINGGRVGDALLAVPCGVNSSAMVLNATPYEEVGIKAPYPGITWDEFAANAAELAAKTKRPHFYGTSDASGREPAYETWLRQNGKALYTADGKLGYDVDDATAWFAMWKDMRDKHACPPADIEALDLDTFETGLINTGYAATNWAFSSNLLGYQSLNKEPLSLVSYPVPSKDSHPGHYLKPAMLFSIAKSTQQLQPSLAYLSFLLADLDATKIMGLERGVPLSPAVRDNLAPDLNDQQAAMLNFISGLDDKLLGDLPPLPPTGAGEADKLMLKVSQEVGFGSSTPEQAGKELVDEVTAILERS